jgi:hypothetical protein
VPGVLRLLAQQVPHLCSFGIEVVRVFRIAANNQRHAFNDIDARFSEDLHFFRVIGQQTHFVHAQQLEHICAEGEIALVSSKAELMVGFDGIIALILQRVGADFIQQTDIASFLAVIQQHATSFLCDMRKSGFELETAVTAQAEERVTGQTLRMNAGQYRRLPRNVTVYQAT